MVKVLTGALIGTICTFVFYFIPFVNSIAPLLGGLLGGYYADGGFGGGLKSGVLMTVFMIIPGFLLAGILGAILRDAPVLGSFIVASTFIITMVIVAHTAVIGIIGSIIGAVLAEKREAYYSASNL
jgi:ABC-type dipeptide/oligopeptide/nickel transport system permease subunit